MSELKWTWDYYPYLDAPNEQGKSVLKVCYIKVVCKSEADKVIAHHKYKRCLAMADYCFARSVAEDVLHTNRDGIEHADYWICRHKMWLEIAEKFKEAK